MYKAVVTDLDGTLLNDEHKVSEFTKETVRKIIDKGIKFYIATGRNYGLAKVVKDELGINIPLISSNGARINDEDGKVIYEDGLGRKEIDAILSIDYKSFGKDIHLNIFSGDDWIITKGTLEEVIKRDGETFPLDMIEVPENELGKREILKFFYIGKHENLIELEKEILKKTDNNVSVVFVSDDCMEVFSKTANKANAAKFLLKRDGINSEETVSFGDGENDYELLTTMGKGHAMGNAIYRLKNLLPKDFEIIGKNSDDGEAKKLIELFL
ncbi:Cof-type HAD-IIB family hydrolase [Pseudoleptotrichia goodfellowii]|jgi:HAD-superfamily hydrolase, subfamily IIB|uniref:Cof-like hydrolase n=2 Tax=Pseudoleptotrichia goodfellowii TaxID=157692 RepID=D0GNN7_9FUSO|nr:Cof-type HAD-IIB family hydrolase [Pseudoleptotrichia goodfellowii]EEY34319.1 Cof-like hydrolase [Pseudoleptotrichia goodfellowii F0264]MBF4805849.1 Cof-type HAD-IIB family hydrolase [Pseudoleptotrichia goodfellowii]BBM35504.1 Cof-like hydrolase [Pseudoleptotrichia goodfellowii]